PVLIEGETGTGKEALAESLHEASPRRSGPFVIFDCTTVAASLVEAELFGYERGAFTGADATRKGLFEEADSGTLFLDEIGDLDQHLQPKLLRVLEGKGFRRQGGTAEITPNVRVIASASKDLVNEVTAGRFREDLYYRLSVMPINLPPLRARSREDVVELTAHLLDELAPTLLRAPTALGDEALDAILRYAWPGNIRELRNVLERAMLMARGQPKIELAHLPREVQGASGADVSHHVPRSLSEVEKAHIDRTLKAHHHNRTHAARELGISRATLIKKIREYNLAEKPRARV
ncbi:MAG: sigma-54 interaction domain-containing protein, partial [Gemmatimonadales bacterium]